jgi:hypothetical protein
MAAVVCFVFEMLSAKQLVTLFSRNRLSDPTVRFCTNFAFPTISSATVEVHSKRGSDANAQPQAL